MSFDFRNYAKRSKVSSHLFETTDEYLARGGKIRHIPTGVSGVEIMRRKEAKAKAAATESTASKIRLMTARRQAIAARQAVKQAQVTGDWDNAKRAINRARKAANLAGLPNVASANKLPAML